MFVKGLDCIARTISWIRGMKVMRLVITNKARGGMGKEASFLHIASSVRGIDLAWTDYTEKLSGSILDMVKVC
jgi:hypothetical protein